jgi:hypothetical protein
MQAIIVPESITVQFVQYVGSLKRQVAVPAQKAQEASRHKRTDDEYSSPPLTLDMAWPLRVVV